MLSDRYHALAVKGVVTETDDAKSIVFDVPARLAERFTYQSGQFITLRVTVKGNIEYRSYSMSSTPAVDRDLMVTVKRVPGGLVSGWLNDMLVEGAVLDVSEPTGAFVLDDSGDDIVAFAAGSGIVPVFSIVKAALHTTERTVRLLFANRDRGAAIFGAQLDDLVSRFDGRLVVVHHEDSTCGFVTPADVGAFVGAGCDGDFYLCGPTGFMDVVTTGLHEAGVDDERIRIERFTPTPSDGEAMAAAVAEGSAPVRVTITLGTQTKTIDQRGRSTVLDSARWGGLRAPSTCEAGHCATCMARVVEGEVEMAQNDVLTEEEVAEGWVLTCQAVPVTPTVRVVYE